MMIQPSVKRSAMNESEICLLSENIKQSAKWFSSKIRGCFNECNITAHQYSVLIQLDEIYPEAVTLKHLKENMLGNTSDVSRMVDKLEKKKLVERKTCSDDRRKVKIKISFEGLELLAQLKWVSSEYSCVNKKLSTTEICTLNELLKKLLDENS